MLVIFTFYMTLIQDFAKKVVLSFTNTKTDLKFKDALPKRWKIIKSLNPMFFSYSAKNVSEAVNNNITFN